VIVAPLRSDEQLSRAPLEMCLVLAAQSCDAFDLPARSPRSPSP
jgi:hypothetical protein